MLNKTKDQIKQDFERKLITRYSKDVSQAHPLHIYEAFGRLIRDYVTQYWYESKNKYNEK